MNRRGKRIVALLLGWGVLLAGIAGLVLPILPGWILIFTGLIVLSSEYVWAHQLLARIRQRFPKFGSLLDQASEKARSWMHHFAGQHEGD
jgi:uncharacterized membrane protein YbaN (DUF454 family)